jgi:hypothetical protein
VLDLSEAEALMLDRPVRIAEAPRGSLEQGSLLRGLYVGVKLSSSSCPRE